MYRMWRDQQHISFCPQTYEQQCFTLQRCCIVIVRQVWECKCLQMGSGSQTVPTAHEQGMSVQIKSLENLDNFIPLFFFFVYLCRESVIIMVNDLKETVNFMETHACVRCKCFLWLLSDYRCLFISVLHLFFFFTRHYLFCLWYSLNCPPLKFWPHVFPWPRFIKKEQCIYEVSLFQHGRCN